MSKVKIAVIGANWHSHAGVIVKTLKKLSDRYEIAGYNLPENEREKFPPDVLTPYDDLNPLSLQEILENPEIEAVAVETEEIYLTKYAALCAMHGKHIHMEKPGGTNLSDFENLIAKVKENGKTFHVGYMYRYNPLIADIKERIKNGEFGEIINIEAQMNCRHDNTLRTWLSTFPGGTMFFLGCHLTDLIYSIMGEPKRVIPLNKRSGVDKVSSEDFGFALYEYEKGVSFAKTSSVEVGGFMRRQLVISGTEKTVELKPLEHFTTEGISEYLKTTATEYEAESWADRGKTYQSEMYDRYIDMMNSFADMVKGKKENPWSADYELSLYKLILKSCGQ